MSKDAGDPPPAPDPAASAQAQGQSNIATAIANARLNRVNQTTPWGSISYTQGPVDANGVPTYSSEIKLDPQQQAQLDEQRKQQAYKQQLAAVLLGNAGGSLSKPLDLSGAHKVYDRYGSQQPPKPIAQPQAAPQGQGGDRDAMLNQLLQYLESIGQMPGAGGNPNARYAGALRGNAGSPSPSTAAATPGAATSTPAATPSDGSWDRIVPAGADPFGSVGRKPIYDTSTDYNGPAEYRPVSGYDMGAPVTIDGQSYERVGQVPLTSNYFKSTDPSKFKYDPQHGVLTTRDNLTGGTPESFYDKYAPWLMMAGAGAGIAAGAMGGAAAGGMGVEGAGSLGVGAGATGGGAVDLAALGGAAGAAGSATGSTSMPMGEMGGPAMSGPAPVTDLSVQAAQPSMGSTMWNNVTNGRGLFGLSGTQRAGIGAIPALIQLLRNGQKQGGK